MTLRLVPYDERGKALPEVLVRSTDADNKALELFERVNVHKIRLYDKTDADAVIGTYGRDPYYFGAIRYLRFGNIAFKFIGHVNGY